METRPPAVIEALVGRLIPPASREHVLGDLHERYTTPSRYLGEAARLIPRLVAVQIFRIVKVDYALYLAQIAALTLAFARPGAFLSRSAGVLAGQTAALLMLMLLVVRDAYISPTYVPDTREGRREALDAALAVAFIDAAFAVSAAWIVERLLLPAALRLDRENLLDLSAFTFLVLGSLRAAWWALYVPGTRRGRALAKESAASAEQVRERNAQRRTLLAFKWVTPILVLAGATGFWPAGRLSPGLVFLLCGMFSNADLERRLADQFKDDSNVRDGSDRRTLGSRPG